MCIRDRDEYIAFLGKYHGEEADRQLANPVWHIHNGRPPQWSSPVSFALLLNLVSAANAETKEQLWGFITRYAPEASAESHPLTDQLAGYALSYYEDFVKPVKVYREPDEHERAAMEDLAGRLETYTGAETGEELQTLTFSVGKHHDFENLRDWFKALYEVLLGQSQGPRFGGFAALYGVKETAALIREKLSGG